MFDFPNGPVMGDEYTSPDGVKYVWDGLMWAVPGAKLQIAGDTAAEVGIVYVPDDRGLNLTPDGAVTLRPAGQYPNLGGMFEAPLNSGPFARDNGQWVPAVGGGVIISDAAPAVPADGMLWWESDTGRLLVYYDDGTSAQWVEAVGTGATYTFGVGLEETTAGVVDLKPAGFNGEIGGVRVVGRGPENGLEMTGDGLISVPLGNDIIAGSIVEPPNDAKVYARTRSGGVSSWVPSGGAGIHISDSPPTAAAQPRDLWWDSDSGNLFVLYEDADSTQWVQINVVAPPFAGVEEAPTDGQAYLRQSSAWTAGLPLTGGTLTGALIAEGPIDSHNGQTIAVRGPWNPIAGAVAGEFVIGNEDGRKWASMQARYISAAGNGEMELAFGALCGGWGWKEAFKTTLASPSGINVSGDCSAASVTDRTLAAAALADDDLRCFVDGDGPDSGLNLGRLLMHAIGRIKALEARLAARGM